MASSTIFMKRHDTRPHLDVVLQDVDGSAIDLDSNVAGVTFTMIESSSKEIKINQGGCDIIEAGTGKVRYAWEPADTDVAAVYLGEFEVMYNPIEDQEVGDKLTIPTSGTLSIVIMEDYDNA